MFASDKAKAAGLTLKATDYRQPCPQCSPTRKKRKDPCLHVTWEGREIRAKCFHCDWGMVFSDDDEPRREPFRGPRRQPRQQPLRQRTARGW